jgi:acid phosphatase type 7
MPISGTSMIRKCLLWICMAAPVLGCSRDEDATPTPSGEAPKEIVLPGAAVFIGAGDIGVCGTNGDEATAHIVDSVLAAASNNSPSAVFTLGDNAYPSGSGGVDNDFPRCFAPSWGSASIMKVIHPAPGNHDYDSGSGAPYFTFFGERAGPAGKGYYSYDVGGWHLISLNSELFSGPGADPAAVTAQENWLRKDLADHRALCTLAYFHRPLFTSGVGSPTQQVHGFWQILYDGGADVILNGHHHHYERFLPQTPSGVVDTARGIEEIIAGTGGGELRGVKPSLARNSVTAIHGHFGVLKMLLGAGEYSHAFIDTNGRVWDPGRGKCH